VVSATKQGGAALIPFAGAQLLRIIDGRFTGTVTIQGDGTVAGLTGAATAVFGLKYTPLFTPFTFNFAGGESFHQRMRRRKIKLGAITVRNAGPFTVKNRDLAGYKLTDDPSQAMPLRDGTFTFRSQGRSYDPTIELVQDAPFPLEILEFGLEVTA
ncbi:MAG: hypothetical protein ACREIB_10110, partial [Pseudomonadota bacterium]